MQCMLFIKINKEIKYPLECLNIAIKHVKGFFSFVFFISNTFLEDYWRQTLMYYSTHDVMKLDQNGKKIFSFDRKEASKNNWSRFLLAQT